MGIGTISKFRLTLLSVIWMCPQNPNILSDISFLNPDIIAVVSIITVIDMAIAAMAILTITFVKDLLSEKAILFAIKCSIFILNLVQFRNKRLILCL